jgi:hypothetical protein
MIVASAPRISAVFDLILSKVPNTFRIEGKNRSAGIPGILHMSVDPLPTAHLSGECADPSDNSVVMHFVKRAVGGGGDIRHK